MQFAYLAVGAGEFLRGPFIDNGKVCLHEVPLGDTLQRVQPFVITLQDIWNAAIDLGRCGNRSIRGGGKTVARVIAL